MKYAAHLVLSAALCQAAPQWGWGGSWGGGWGGWGAPSGSAQSAVYFLSVDPAGSSIVSIGLENGQLTSETSVTSTEGVGLQSNNASANLAKVEADPLQGQNAVTVFGNVGRARLQLAQLIIN